MSQPALWTPDESESLGRTWGIDPGTTAMALGVHDGFRYTTDSCGLPRHRDPHRRLAAALPVAQEFMERAAARLGQPSLIVVEQPAGAGHSVHPHTWFITGLAVIAAANAVECPIHLVTPPSWKAEALGKGNGHASKAAVLAWARAQGWQKSSQDEADTCGIARCAYLRLAAHLRPG